MWVIRETDILSTSIGMEVVSANVDRVAVFITNLGPNPVTLSNRPPPLVSNGGIQLNSNAVERFRWNHDGYLARCVLYSYLNSASQLHILESIWYPDKGADGGQ